MSLPVIPQSPRRLADSASSSAAGTRPSPGAATPQAHSGLAPRAREHSGTQAPLAPRHRLETSAPGRQTPRGLVSMIESMTHSVLNPPIQAAGEAFQRLGEALMSRYMPAPRFDATPPAAPLPYVAPSLAGYQCVSFAQMTPEDARAALLAMDLSPQFLEAMKSDLNYCTHPFSLGCSPANQQQFVAAYGHLVAMPHGLDGDTVAALTRMLAAPEPDPPSRAQATAPRQSLPVLEMSFEDARAALRAMEVAPQVLARMAEDVLGCVEAAGSPAGLQRAQQFRRDHGHLLALPPHLDATTLTVLVNLLMDLDPVEPQAEPRAPLQPESPSAQTQPLPLHTMEPADALQALLAQNVTEQQLSAMAEDLHGLVTAYLDEGGDEQAYDELAHKFALAHGHLIALPAPLDINTLHALVGMLRPYLNDETD